MWIKYTEDDTQALLNLNTVSGIELTGDSNALMFLGTSTEDHESMVNILEFKDHKAAKAAFDKIMLGIESGDKLLVLHDKFSLGADLSTQYPFSGYN